MWCQTSVGWHTTRNHSSYIVVNRISRTLALTEMPKFCPLSPSWSPCLSCDVRLASALENPCPFYVTIIACCSRCQLAQNYVWSGAAAVATLEAGSSRCTCADVCRIFVRTLSNPNFARLGPSLAFVDKASRMLNTNRYAINTFWPRTTVFHNLVPGSPPWCTQWPFYIGPWD